MTDHHDIDKDDIWFESKPIADQPGWFSWAPYDQENYNAILGIMHMRAGGDNLPDDMGRVRFFPEKRHRNLGDVVHGGALMGFIDCALFATMRLLRLGQAAPSVTVELQTQFVSAAQMDAFLEARVEVMKETGSMLFMRGLVVQGANENNVVSFSAIIKKASRKSAA